MQAESERVEVHERPGCPRSCIVAYSTESSINISQESVKNLNNRSRYRLQL